METLSDEAQSRAGPGYVDVPLDPLELTRRSVAEGWGDGLPIIPPTEDRVDEMLEAAGEDPDRHVGRMPPGRRLSSVRHVAANAVMAGCTPELFPVVLAAVEALVAQQTRFNLYGALATTNPVTVAGFVSGPAVDELGFNSGWNCLGPGNHANATVGRAILLCCLNLGGARPGHTDLATHGFPGKYTFFFAEAPTNGGWTTVPENLGMPDGASTITLFAPSGSINMLEFSERGDELVDVFAQTLSYPTGNDYMSDGEPWLVLSPEHAEILEASGYGRERVQREIWERSQLPLGAFTDRTVEYVIRPKWEPILGSLGTDAKIPVAASPEQIKIVVCGGPSVHSVWLPTFGDARHIVVPLPQEHT